MFIEMLAVGKLLYDGNKSLNMDAEALAKYNKAFTKEYEAQRLVEQKRSQADKRLENVAKKKKAIIGTSLPMFVNVYQQIQKIKLSEKEHDFEMVRYTADERLNCLQTMSLVQKKEFTDKELIVGCFIKGISGMMVEDSKRNLSAARSQMHSANVVHSQACSIAAVYDAIIERSERIAKLLANMNALFIGIINESDELINKNGTNVRNYSEKEKSVLMLCVDFAVAMTDMLDIPILDENGEIAEAAVEMIETGESYLKKMNEMINE